MKQSAPFSSDPRIYKYLFLFLLVAHLVPIWFFRYFPSQDGMVHVYNAYILKSYQNPALYKTREVFQLNLTIFPNWVSHLLMAGSMLVVPPLIAEKILLTLCIVGVPLAFLYFQRSVDPENDCYVWLGFLFSYHYLLHMGFYNFSLSFALFFVIFGYWWRHRQTMTAKRIGGLYLMLVLLYLCHIVSYALVLAAIGLAACLTLRPFRSVVTCTGYMMPAGILLLNYILDTMQGAEYKYHSGSWFWEYLWKNRSLLAFNDDFLWVNTVLLSLLLTLIAYTLWREKIEPRIVGRGKGPGFSSGPNFFIAILEITPGRRFR